jgi:hypothetical protein
MLKEPILGTWALPDGSSITIVKTASGYGLSEGGQIVPAQMSVSGNKVTFQSRINQADWRFDGTLKGDEMVGQITAVYPISYRRKT